MTKKDIIKQEIMGSISIPNILPLSFTTNPNVIDEYKIAGISNLAIVDIDKLAEFLAKHIKTDDLIDKDK